MEILIKLFDNLVMNEPIQHDNTCGYCQGYTIFHDDSPNHSKDCPWLIASRWWSYPNEDKIHDFISIVKSLKFEVN